ncbi:delta-like protein 1 [Littorina saxatilis]|uniref:delta-like protein 1 n=1 Tax=Littorina saxatilis TaxID=31220 RepID=UPI0038B60EF4
MGGGVRNYSAFDSFGFQQLTYAARDCDNKTVIPNMCKNITCLNGGVCYHDSNNAAKCNCSAGYTGDRCEVSKCENNGPCVRGICRIDKNGDVVCDCTGTGYVGPFCDELNPDRIALICVSTLFGVVMTAGGAGVYCARKQRSGGQQNAPPADAPPANAPLANAPQVNDPRYNTPPDNAPPDNAPQVAGSAGPSTGQTVQTTPYDEPGESSVAGSEASEGTEYNASDVSDV